jgi:ABC-type phosphate/phosphonate transport system substrate-binding protein
MSIIASSRLAPAQNEFFWRTLAGLGIGISNGDHLPPAQTDLVFLCGLPALGLLPTHRPLAAAAADDSPVAEYFARVVVAAAHPSTGLADLGHARFAYNERGSFSGYAALLHGFGDLHLSPATGAWIGAGSHREALRMVVEGEAEAASIDSMVLESELARRPELRPQVRVVASLGPWPAPPVMISRQLDPQAASCIQALFAASLDAPLPGLQWHLVAADHLAPIAAAGAAR